MIDTDTLMLVTALICFVLVLLLFMSSVKHVQIATSASTITSAIYEDIDGRATEQSTAEYYPRREKILLAIFSISGLCNAVALAGLSSFSQRNELPSVITWINVTEWVLVLCQVVATIRSYTPTLTYSLAIRASFSSTIILTYATFQYAILILRCPDLQFSIHASALLQLAQSLLASAVLLTGFSIPRRPEVFHNGLPVDAMHTSSAWSRTNLSWVVPLITLANNKTVLRLDDFPGMDHNIRSQETSATWTSRKHPGRLWWELCLDRRWQVLRCYFLGCLSTATLLGPNYALYRIIRILEARQAGEQVSQVQAWLWVATLLFATYVPAFLDQWANALGWSDIAFPIRAQLATLIFLKSMRRKNTKEPKKPDIKSATAGSESTSREQDGSSLRTNQPVLNLIGVDCDRLAQFICLSFQIPAAAVQLLTHSLFLLDILGWRALLAGYGAIALLIPINIKHSKGYCYGQVDLMKVRDVKMAVVTEALQGIRQIKFSALESAWFGTIARERSKELESQWKIFYHDAWLVFVWVAGPVILAATSLCVYAWQYGTLSPSVAFTTIAIFGGLEVALAAIPEMTTNFLSCKVSVDRIEKYLNLPEITVNNKQSDVISFENATVAWPSDENHLETERFLLRNLDFTFPRNELSLISGKTGAGKSLLLSSVLGEVDVLKGRIRVPRPPCPLDRRDQEANQDNWIIANSIAYVAQIPWIENASVKDNILFGLPLDQSRYQKVLGACALKDDIDTFIDGENTEIGVNGINLSGGQKWRLSFARALYSRAGILVLDDIFSAVDAHVGRHIFEQGLVGELGLHRTRLLVTHHVELCRAKAAYVVELGDGKADTCGMVQQSEETGALESMLTHEEVGHKPIEIQKFLELAHEVAPNGNSNGTMVDEELKVPPPREFVGKEWKAIGRVDLSVYKQFFSAFGGIFFWTFGLSAFVIAYALVLGRGWWVKLWTSENQETVSFFHAPLQPSQKPSLQMIVLTSTVSSHESLRYYLCVYLLLCLLGVIFNVGKYIIFYFGTIRQSRKVFDRFCNTMLRAPLRWYDTVPLGRILNRFTSDFNITDSRLFYELNFATYHLTRLIGIFLVGILISPWMLLCSALILYGCISIARSYLAGAREAKRFESVTKSPVFECFDSALTGVSTIRSFNKEDVYITRFFHRNDDYSKTSYYLWLINRWLAWRLTVVGALFAAVVAAVTIMFTNISASFAGFALSFAVEFSTAAYGMILRYANLELNMNAAERVMEYSNLPMESLDGADPPAAWPTEGRLEVNDLVVKYADDLPPVLKGLTFCINANERIGVVGRTGAGKSSLTLALFRFLEATEGSILIDGIDISKIKLEALRSRLAIIPQDPVLFSGTVRSNLDLFNAHSDDELNDALERVHLNTAPSAHSQSPISTSQADNGDVDTNRPLNLDSPISSSGHNLSQGQRQLICLARAIVSRPKIMVLDEATSAVDMKTDASIQRSIREEFGGNTTLIVIAHRLSSVVDFDRILVLDGGEVREFGTPLELMAIGGQHPEQEKDRGFFRRMVEASGEKERLKNLIYRENQ